MKRALIGAVALGIAAASLVSGSATAKPKDPLVYQTLPASKENAFFDISTLYHPQVGQSLSISTSMTWRSVEMGTFQVKLVNDPKVYQWLVDGKYDEKWFTSHMGNYTVKARVTVELWRQNDSGATGDQVDLLADFTRVHRSSSLRKIHIGKRVTFPIRGGVNVEPGKYFAVVGVRFTDKRVFNLRFTGQENGTNTMGGFDHDHPVPEECANYDMTKDAHPGGQAYRPLSNTQPKPPTWLAPFATSFEAVDTKVAMGCNMDGNYDPNAQIWNPGDITMGFRGDRR